MSPQPPPTVLFDLDGTCVDSDALHFRAYREVLLKALPSLNDGHPITRQFYDDNMSGKQNRNIMAELGSHLAPEVQLAVWQEKERLYLAYVDQGIQPLTGLLPLLDRLDSIGAQYCIVTNAPRTMAQHTIAALQLKQRFGERVIIGEECERPKPEPHPYLAGLAMCSASRERTVAFEDSPSGIASARAAGLFTVGMMSSRTEEDLQKAGANMCVRNYEDVNLWPTLVKQLGLHG